MPPSDDEPELTANIFVILRDLIHERLGIYYDAEKRRLLAEKLAPYLGERGMKSFLDYYYLLKYGPGADEEWPNVVDALSVQETYFWREIGQIQALVDRLLPGIVAADPNRPVSIWCAACATGEEPLTIAMYLNEAGWFDRLPIKICASDASPAALIKARRGVYRDRSFRAIPGRLVEKYFTDVSGGRQIAPELHARIHWARANLTVAEEIAPFAASQIIFCRNVFIYFSEQMIARTVRRMAESMQRPGYLFVGAAESLLKISTDFELQEAGDAFVYALP
ncbi:MAG: chemotaxis protein CheR [Pirellula sp.]|nr:chemotaxis protein CheR [Pirellula sp.]